MGNPRVLVIDDDLAVREAISAGLRLDGYDLIFAENGADALAALKRSTPRVVILDLKMPVMDGFEATRQIRRNSLNSQTPIIALTGLTGENERQQCLTAGMNDFIGKPFTQDQIQATLVQWINNYYGSASD